MRRSTNIAIIGAGLGGISAAIRLATRGYHVSVFEKNDYAGGKAGSLSMNGFRFDSGPTLLTMPFILSELFKCAGEEIEYYLTISKPKIICKYFYPDGTIINAYSDIKEFSKEIMNKTYDDSLQVLNYLNYCKTIYDLTGELFLFKSPTRLASYLNLKALYAMLNLRRIDTLRTVDKDNRSFFKDKRVIQLFNRYATYNGSDPFKAPATLNIIPHVEMNLGGFIIEGGMYSLTKSLTELALKKGVQFNYNSGVSQIKILNGKAAGIKINGMSIESDAVISNADVEWTYRNLINNNYYKRKIIFKKPEPSLSGIVFFWGVKNVHHELEIHNIIFSEDYKKEFDQIFREHICPEDPTIYIHISSRYNKRDAPAGCENWFVMINAPHINGQDWDNIISRAKETVIRIIKTRLNIDLKESIISEKIMSPVEIEKSTNSPRGSIYGYSSNSRYSAFLRHPNYSRIKRLYFCGGSVHPGGGIPLVLLSGKIASELLVSELEKRS